MGIWLDKQVVQYVTAEIWQLLKEKVVKSKDTQQSKNA